MGLPAYMDIERRIVQIDFYLQLAPEEEMEKKKRRRRKGKLKKYQIQSLHFIGANEQNPWLGFSPEN